MIKIDMDMPKCCADCHMHVSDYIEESNKNDEWCCLGVWFMGAVSTYEFNNSFIPKNRHIGCPLIDCEDDLK